MSLEQFETQVEVERKVVLSQEVHWEAEPLQVRQVELQGVQVRLAMSTNSEEEHWTQVVGELEEK